LNDASNDIVVVFSLGNV